MTKTLVLKFGGASLKDVAHFNNVAQIIQRECSNYDRICVVVSAMAGMTDLLESLAKKVHANPPKRETDMLLSTGERVSMSLLAMILQSYGVDAISLTGSQAGIITTNEHSNAKILDIKPLRLNKIFEEKKVAIIAGFQGVSEEKEITTLGRGGSDITAVALAVALKGEKVVFYKDVPGVCIEDPKKNPKAKMIKELTYDEALEVIKDGRILHKRSIILAKKNNVILQVRSFACSLQGNKGSKLFSVRSDKNLEKLYEQSYKE